ncbi:GIN domain-containing protein [Winogradskyella sp. PE311]|uniref:GIN domain-containing protein n=1 Tax=Winogradskyella sp. PE311 TaxID=3366943 RepID=UPI003981628A
MKIKITLMLLLIGMIGTAQIKGNKSIETRNFNVDGVEHIKINFYAKTTIDQAAKEGMQITTDSNLFDLINTEVIDGVLHLNQKEWISPSQKTVISIGAPNLKRIESGTHDTTKIINIDNEELRVNAPIGNISIEGKTKELRLGSELATIDASKIIAEKVYVNLWSWGKVIVNPTDLLWADVSNDGKLIYINEPKKFEAKTKKRGHISSLNNSTKVKNPEAIYINFKIKNNSGNRNHFEVVGPKPDGSKFGYGFPMMPNTSRKENWTIGTKVYKVSSLGFRKLLIEIKPEDENTTIKLFD